MTGGFLGPAIAAISLGLVGHSVLAERLGRNQRFASAGVIATTGLMGAIGYFLSYQWIFLASAALTLPLLVALARIRSTDIHFGRACGRPDHDAPTPPPRARRLSLWKKPQLTHICWLLVFISVRERLHVATRRRTIGISQWNRRLIYRLSPDSSFPRSSSR